MKTKEEIKEKLDKTRAEYFALDKRFWHDKEKIREYFRALEWVLDGD